LSNDRVMLTGLPGLNSVPTSRPFLALLGLQAAHSIEEYIFRLYADFPPAQLVSGLFFFRTGVIS
jgi:hypothetical protein